MLLELRIENLLLIERAELRLGPGLNAITGETGAGKTILAHSFDLLLGGKARPQHRPPRRERGLRRGGLRALRWPARRSRAGRDRRAPSGGERRAGRRAAGLRHRQDERLPRGRSASALGPAGPRHAPARLLRTARAPQADAVRARSSRPSTALRAIEHLERRRDYREPMPRSSVWNESSSASGEREGARERDLDLLRFELEEIEAANPDAGRGGRAAARARAASPRRGPAWRGHRGARRR